MCVGTNQQVSLIIFHTQIQLSVKSNNTLKSCNWLLGVAVVVATKAKDGKKLQIYFEAI